MLFLIKTEVSIGYVVALKKEFLLRVKANAIDGGGSGFEFTPSHALAND